MKKFNFILAILLLISGSIFYYNNYYFNADKIIKNSILKDKTFNAKVKEVTSSDGKVKAYHIEDNTIPLVAINFSFDKSGKAYEPKDGVVLFTKSLILDGAGKYNKKELRKIMKEKGIKIGISSDNDSINFSVSYVKEFEDIAKEIIKSVLFAPLIPNQEIEVLKQQVKMLKKKQKEQPQYELSSLIRDEFYTNHPYSKAPYPTNKQIDSITDKDIKNYMNKYFTKDMLTIGSAGNINTKDLSLFLDDVFSELKDNRTSNNLPKFNPIYNNETKIKNANYSKQTFSTHIRPGIKRQDKDFYPFYIANYIFGGSGLNSRLNKSIREKDGLTYGIYSYMTENDSGCYWNISYSATDKNATKIEKLLENEINNFYQNGITKEELELAKNSLISSFNLRFASLFEIALQLNMIKKQNLGQDFLEKRQDIIKNITLSDVNKVIKNRFSPNKRVFILKAKEN